MEIQVEALQWRQLPANDKKSSWKSNTRHWNWIPLSRRRLLEAGTIVCHVFHILRFECDLRPAWLIQSSCFFLNNISACVALPCERYQWISRHFIRALRLGAQVHFAPRSDSCNGLTHASSAYEIAKCGGSGCVYVLDVLDPYSGPSGFKTSQIPLSPTLCLLMLSVLKFNREAVRNPIETFRLREGIIKWESYLKMTLPWRPQGPITSFSRLLGDVQSGILAFF